jgi:3-hydroxyacyl-[acyl-carrier-protein] dehydratase
MSTVSPDEIRHRIETILRRDLKLGPDAQIPPDMPFFGGDVDLDSLDILLLVTSIEKEFGVKIPSSDVGKEVFQNVGTLASYVEKNLGTGTSSPVDYLSRLPHRDPFRFVNRVTEVREGHSAEGVWTVTGEEPFFAGHFPGKPLVPGVLITEALAQISGLVSGAGGGGGMLAHTDIRFEHPVTPPAQILLRSTLARTLGSLQQFDVSAHVNGVVVATGSLALHRGGGGGGD